MDLISRGKFLHCLDIFEINNHRAVSSGFHQIVYQTEKTLNEMGDKLDAADKSEVESKLTALKTALTGTDTAAIQAATEELTQAFYKVSEKMYQAAGGAQGAGFDPNQAAGGAQGGTSGNGQDYYDADYTVVDDDKK